MKKLSVFGLGLLFLLFPLIGVQASTIQIGEEFPTASGTGYRAIQLFEPIGQSFLAEDINVSIAFSFQAMNLGYDSADPIVFSLFEGEGFSGTLLGSQDVVVPSGHEGWFAADFSSIDLAINNTYTAQISVSGDSPYWAVYYNNDVYSQGVGYSAGVAYSVRDFSLLVTPGAVPEPTTIALFGIGLISLAGVARKKQQ